MMGKKKEPQLGLLVLSLLVWLLANHQSFRRGVRGRF